MKASPRDIEPSIRLYFSGHEQTQPEHRCGPGVWPHFLLHFVLSGCGTFTCKEKSWKLSTGDAFLIIPGVVSGYISDADDPWEYCWIGFDGREAHAILASCSLNADSPVWHGSSLPGNCLLSLNDALYTQPGNTYLHLSLLYRFFSLLAPQAGSAAKAPSDYLKQALYYIQHNYAYDIRIQDLARHVGVDRTYLYKLFMRELDTSPQQYLIQYRLLMAKQLLSATTLQISEIANSCGFTDSASFCHHFKAQFSITPTQFRKEPGGTPVGTMPPV